MTVRQTTTADRRFLLALEQPTEGQIEILADRLRTPTRCADQEAIHRAPRKVALHAHKVICDTRRQQRAGDRRSDEFGAIFPQMLDKVILVDEQLVVTRGARHFGDPAGFRGIIGEDITTQLAYSSGLHEERQIARTRGAEGQFRPVF